MQAASAEGSHVAICSLVRDGLHYLSSFRRQLESLDLNNAISWSLYCLEGDSRDSSWEYLKAWKADDPRITIGQFHVGRAVGKSAIAENWAKVCNACFDLIPSDSEHTHVLWLESDLCFPPEILRRLLAHKVDIVAPVIFLGGQFYDTWGFRGLDGTKWTNCSPYHRDYTPAKLIPMQAVGSCVLFDRCVLDSGIRMRGEYENGLLVGMCNDARVLLGLNVWADTGTAILHPVDHWERQMWKLSEVVLQDSEDLKTLQPDEFFRCGIQPLLPVLDPETIVSSHSRFLGSVFQCMGTNQLMIEVFAVTQPRRLYQMRIFPDGSQSIVGDLSLSKDLVADDLDSSSKNYEHDRDASISPLSEHQCHVVIYQDPE